LEEKAYIIEGTATLTADDEAKHGTPVSIGPKDMVTFPKGWTGRWDVDSFLQKKYAFFDSKGLRVDEDESDDEDGAVDNAEDDALVPAEPAAKRKAKDVVVETKKKLKVA
jgi:hypothetical protein